jgi:hypothetical protein
MPVVKESKKASTQTKADQGEQTSSDIDKPRRRKRPKHLDYYVL